MTSSLVIVESPAKAKTIGKYLGRNYVVKATMGHFRDLPRSQFGVDIEKGFQPKYITIRGRGAALKELKDAVKKADRVYLATDPDREGEAISWHLAEALGMDLQNAKRVEFHEITKPAVTEAIKKPRRINMSLVNAQQTRRILDRIVGYKLSPLLWSKVRSGLSAGRVQSVAVKLIVDREDEINAFVAEEYWTIHADLATDRGESFRAKLHTVDDKKPDLSDSVKANQLAERARAASYRVQEVRAKDKKRYPAPPFTTSSLQQDASRRLGFTTRKTMMIAQQLYEGLDLGAEGTVGLISYMRTDSTRVSTEAQAEAREYVDSKYGPKYLPAQAPQYKNKQARAQDAHEAIRPTAVGRIPDKIKGYLTRDQHRLYKLIWERFVASQMAPAQIQAITADIDAGGLLFRATGQIIKFQGFLSLYAESTDEEKGEDEGILPEMHDGEKLQLQKVEPQQHFTQPPPRFTEAMLVRTLEEKGIGRPSTYAPIIETITKRNYVFLESKRFRPTELGEVVVRVLEEHFPQIVGVEFTASMEEKLDKIEDGNADWVQVLAEFYGPFEKDLEKAEQVLEKVEVKDEESEEVCEHCGRRMVFKHGRFGRFLACPGYPECKNTKPIQRQIGVQCPDCGGDVVERRSRKGRLFYGCNKYPECSFVSWDEPTGGRCPICNHILVYKKVRGEKSFIACSEKRCSYRAKLPMAENEAKENQH